jgi:hypothetical protein
MKIIEEDLVDWEPLVMRFDSSRSIAADRKADLCAFLEDWFRTNATAKRSDCDIRSWNVDVNGLSASCEHLTRVALRRLTKAIDRRFPEIDVVRLGVALGGLPSGIDFNWVALAEQSIDMDGVSHRIHPLAISKFHVSLGQFTEFMSESGYVPDCDKVEYSGYLESHMTLNWGKNPKTPVFGVTFNDAQAFCNWANVRLPSEIELHLFFAQEVTSGGQSDWGGDCWTTTQTPSGNYILRNGPYSAPLDVVPDRCRSDFPADHYDYPFPVFRVARSLRA